MSASLTPGKKSPLAQLSSKAPGTAEGFEALCRQLEIGLPHSDDTSILAQKVRIADWTTPNRMVALPMEGCDALPDGTPGKLTFRRYGRMAAGGAGLIWLEACAVVAAGRSKPTALYLHAANVKQFRKLVDHMREEARRAMGHEIITVLQLTHSGRYCRPTGEPAPVVTHHNPLLDERENFPADQPLISDAELDALGESFVNSARLAAEAGFDGVDVKACHGYLISALLGAHLRPGRYGGSYENRTRFFRETVRRIMAECPRLLVTARLNLFDGIPYPYGFGSAPNAPTEPDLREPLQLASELASLGMPLLSLSLGFPRTEPQYGRPAVTNARVEHPLTGVARYIALAGSVQRALPQMSIINGGLAWLEGHLPRVAAGIVAAGGATLIGMGRNSLAYPEAASDMIAGRGFDRNKGCVTCSGCSRLLAAGLPVGCIVRDRSIYAKSKPTFCV